MRALIAALLFIALLALPAAAQESDNGLLVYGALAGGHGGVAWQRAWEHFRDTLLLTNANRAIPYWELDFLSAGAGYHWGETGVMLSATTLPISLTGLSAEQAYAMGPTLFAHVVRGATRDWVNTRPVLDAFVGYAPFNWLWGRYVLVGAEAKWRFWVVSPSVRAEWLWFFGDETMNPKGDNSHTVSLSAGLELGGIWALGHRE